MKHIRLFPVLLVVIASIPAFSQEVPERSEIEEQFKWDLTPFYASDDAWEADFEKVQALMPELTRFKGRLAESGETLYEAIMAQEEAARLLTDLYVFSGLKFFEDQRAGKYGGMFSRAGALNSQYGEATAYFQPEILEISDDRLGEMIEGTEDLHVYRHYFDSIARQRAYTLSEAEEKLLAKASDPLGKFYNVFSAIDNADLTYGTMLDENDEEVELTKARFSAFLRSPDRRVRKDAWIGMFQAYQDLGSTLAANYEGHVKSRVFFADARGYDSALHAATYSSAIPVEVYTNLIATARENAEPLQRYLKIRQEQLGVDTMEVWDLYAPTMDVVFADLEWEEAQVIVAEGLSPLGEEYIALYHRGFEERWVDAFESRGKRGGAYHWSTYRSPKYVSMNYEGTLDDVFTLAHEYGHSLHSWMSHAEQPWVYAYYKTFIAEVASMTNEAIVLKKMLGESETRDQKLELYQNYLDRFRGAFFRQISFADFEMQAHAMVEDGRPLTKETLDTLYADVFEAYYGDAVHAHPLNAAEWSRIPHFLRTDNFYVYQYATSFAAAQALAQKIFDEGQPAVDRFLNLLKSGSKDYPIDMLKEAGVDMTTPEPFLQTIEAFEGLVEEYEATLGN
ncbi:MAG TPA: oligoendopeptidase F [Rhodothermales bacterium]|nr:oligoendopeptidase F [Rhodothermales bacterium]